MDPNANVDAEKALAAAASNQSAQAKPSGLTPDTFKQRLVNVHPNGVASDGRKYSDIPAAELTQMVVNVHPDGVTKDGYKYSDFLPPAPVVQPAPEMNIVKKGANVAVGAAKGLLETLRGVGGNDTNPFVKNMIASGGPALQASDTAEKNALVSANAYQTGGKILEHAAEGLVPMAGVAGDINAARTANSMNRSMQIASPKNTLSAAEKLLSSTSEDPLRIKKGAQVIDDLVKKDILKVGDDAKTATNNSNAIKGEISDTAEGLVNELKTMEIKPIVQQGEIEGLFKNALDEIKGNLNIGAGKQAAVDNATMAFEKFKSFLPKGQDLTAEDILSARKSFDKWVEAQPGGERMLDSEAQTAKAVIVRAIRQNMNDLIASKAPDGVVKAAFQRQTALYDVLENVAEKGAPAIKEARKLADMPGIAGWAARNPLKAGALKWGASTAATGLGLGTVFNWANRH